MPNTHRYILYQVRQTAPGGGRGVMNKRSQLPEIIRVRLPASMLTLCCLLITLLSGKAASAQDEIGPDALWFPSAEAGEAMDACLYESESCILDAMKAHGASAQAIMVAEYFEGRGYLIEFEETGLIDRATLFYPGRANDNWEPVLVNGEPLIVEVPWAVEGDVRLNQYYAPLAQRYPKMRMWNGDNHFEGMEPRAEGGQRFIFGFNLVDGCHACEVLGVARVAFDFDETGRFLGTTYLPPMAQEKPVPEPPPVSEGLIAYIGRDGNVWLISSDGSGQRQLTNDAIVDFDSDPATFIQYCCLKWSPDGRMLAFEQLLNADYQEHLLVYSLQEEELQELVVESNLLGFDWSSDSSTIVYGRSIPEAYWGRDEAESIAVDGLWQVNMATGAASELIPAHHGLPLAGATFSPDGNYLAFIEVEYIEGSQPFAVFDFRDQRYHRWGEPVGSFDWAPDGSFLVFDGINYVERGEGIIRSDPFGANRQTLTFPDGSSSDAIPLVSPTGDLVAFRRGNLEPGGPGKLWVVRSDGSNARELTPFDIHYDFTWGPSDEWVVVVAGDHRSEEIRLVHQPTGESHYLTDGKAPAWQPVTTTTTPINAEPWLEEKESLIRQLEDMDIPTSLFAVPALAAYDEDAAADLLAQVQAQHEQGELSEEQLDAFIRLTLQERAFSELLPAYTEVAATISDTTVDTVETAIGALFIAKPAWDRCRERIPFCGRLQRSTERFVWRLVSDLGRVVIRNFGPSAESREAGATFWDLVVNMVEDAFAQGHSLQDMLVDNTVEAAATTTLVRLLYLRPTQQLLDDGVTTADLASGGQKPWPIRGERTRAEMLVDAYIEQAAIQQQQALDRHEDFQAATDFIKLAEDAADMATLSPAALMAQTVGFWARVEHLVLINLPLTYLNYRNLDCVSYLSQEAARAVFVANEPFGSCQDRESFVPSQMDAHSKRTPQSSSAEPTLLTEEAEDYRTALAALVEATDASELSEIEGALERLETAEVALADNLDELLALTLARDSAGQSDEAFITAQRGFTTRQLSLYPALASVLMAREDEEDPPVDIHSIAEDITTQLEAVEQAAGTLEASPPPGPVLVIGNMQAELIAAETMVSVLIRNVGAEGAAGMHMVVLGDDQQPLADEAAGDLEAGAEVTIVTNIPSNDPGSPLTVQLWAQDRLIDAVWFTADAVIEPVPSGKVEETKTPVESADTAGEGTSEVAEATAAVDLSGDSPTTEPKENASAVLRWVRTWWPAGLALFLIAAAVTGGGLWLRRRRSGGQQPIDSPNRFCIHCGAEYPATGKFCIKCGKPRE